MWQLATEIDLLHDQILALFADDLFDPFDLVAACDEETPRVLADASIFGKCEVQDLSALEVGALTYERQVALGAAMFYGRFGYALINPSE